MAYDNWTANGAVVVATLAAVCLCALIHYEGLSLLARGLARRPDHQPRRKVLYGIFAILALHIVEIWLFGVTYWMLLLWPETGSIASTAGAIAPGSLASPAHLRFFDSIYLSAMTYTTVGFGDLAPLGPVRFLSGTEALTGFVMITWSASFTFLEMERFWRR